MRAKIKPKMKSLKSGGLNNEERQEPQEKPDTHPAPGPAKKPDKKDYKGRTGGTIFQRHDDIWHKKRRTRNERRFLWFLISQWSNQLLLVISNQRKKNYKT